MINEVQSLLQQRLPFKKTLTPSGWYKFNGPCCIHNGQPRTDTKERGGVIFNSDTISYHCFNCNFKCTYKEGSLLSRKMIMLLGWLGVDYQEIARLKFRIWQNLKLNGIAPSQTFEIKPTISFKEEKLPDGSMPWSYWIEDDCQDPNFHACLEYINNRNPRLLDYTYYWAPTKKNRLNRSVIIPFYYNKKVVGWTARRIDPGQRYLSNVPVNYLYNNHVMDKNRQYIIVVEGVLDATIIDGIGCLRNELNKAQIDWLNSCDQEIIVVPDRNKAGRQLVEIALEQNWAVSIPPDWASDISDVEEATRKYGKLFVLQDILKNYTYNKVQTTVAMNLYLGK